MTALIRIDRSFTPARDGRRARPIRFCSRCGHPADESGGPRPARAARVCGRCGMGLLLTCSAEALPGSAAAFMIVTFELLVSAVSEAGERYFGEEGALVGTPFLDHVTSPLARSVAQAAQRAAEPVVLPLRLTPSEHAGAIGTLAARVATCGPPRAALVTVEPSEFGRR